MYFKNLLGMNIINALVEELSYLDGESSDNYRKKLP